MDVIAAAVAGAVVTLAFVIIDAAADITAAIAVIAFVVVVIAVAFVIAVAIDISNADAVCVVYAGACCIYICMYLDARVKLYLLRASICWPSSTTCIVSCHRLPAILQGPPSGTFHTSAIASPLQAPK